jgi:hypothetical protein
MSHLLSCQQISFLDHLTQNSIPIATVRPGTHYPQVTWAHVMLRLYLGYLILNSVANSHFWKLCLRYVIWRGALVGSRASTPLKFLLSHSFREMWRTCRVLFNTVTSCFQKWRKCLRKSAPTNIFIWHQATSLQRSTYESQRTEINREGFENKT